MMSIDDDGKVVRQQVTLPGVGHNVVRLNHTTISSAVQGGCELAWQSGRRYAPAHEVKSSQLTQVSHLLKNTIILSS